jgi:hydrogenase maturation protease
LNPATPRSPVLVLGMGNLLLEDEGLGVRALEILQRRYEIPPEVELLDGGTTGMGLLDDISEFSMRISPHQLGLSDVLATLELSGEKPAEVVVLGLVPQSLEMSLELTELIAEQLATLVGSAVTELERLGYAVESGS